MKYPVITEWLGNTAKFFVTLHTVHAGYPPPPHHRTMTNGLRITVRQGTTLQLKAQKHF